MSGRGAGPTVTVLLQAVDAAQRAPSVRNTQPWRWRVSAAGLQLRADPDRAAPSATDERRDLLFSCGAVLQHLTVVALAAGWATRVTRFPDPTDADHLADIAFRAATPGPDDVVRAAAVAGRQTDRRPYAQDPVPVGWWHQLTATAAVHDVHLVLVDPSTHHAGASWDALLAAELLVPVPAPPHRTGPAWACWPPGRTDPWTSCGPARRWAPSCCTPPWPAGQPRGGRGGAGARGARPPGPGRRADRLVPQLLLRLGRAPWRSAALPGPVGGRRRHGRGAGGHAGGAALTTPGGPPGPRARGGGDERPWDRPRAGPTLGSGPVGSDPSREVTCRSASS